MYSYLMLLNRGKALSHRPLTFFFNKTDGPQRLAFGVCLIFGVCHVLCIVHHHNKTKTKKRKKEKLFVFNKEKREN